MCPLLWSQTFLLCINKRDRVAGPYMWVNVCVCACKGKRGSESKAEPLCLCACACVCVGERERSWVWPTDLQSNYVSLSGDTTDLNYCNGSHSHRWITQCRLTHMHTLTDRKRERARECRSPIQHLNKYKSCTFTTNSTAPILSLSHTTQGRSDHVNEKVKGQISKQTRYLRDLVFSLL